MTQGKRPNFIAERTEFDAKDEPFGIDPIADRLANMLKDAKPPLTISLSGEWGVGKTTLVERLVKKLPPDYAHATIDLWISDPRELRQTLAIEITTAAAVAAGEDEKTVRESEAGRLDAAARTGEATPVPARLSFPDLTPSWNAIQDNWPRAAVAALGIIVLLELALIFGKDNPIGVLLGTSLAAIVALVFVKTGVLLAVETSTKSVAPATEEVLFTAELRIALRGAGPDPKTVLVVVDNLDRLQPHETMQALGDIRFFVDDKASRCLFLIPVDRWAFERIVGGRVSGPGGARDYLDKFFNVDILLTKPAALDMRRFARALMARAFGPDDASDISDAAVIAATAANGTPRSVKRIVNGMVARYLSIEDDARTGITLAKLAIVEGLIARFPNAVRKITNDPRLLVTARTTLVAASPGGDRVNAVQDLFDRNPSGVIVAEEGELNRLVDFLISVEPFALAADEVQTILSLRQDRDWLGITNAREIKEAVTAGDGAGLALAIEASQTEEVCERVIARIKDDAESGYRLSVINAINALSVVIPATSALTTFRRSALEALVAAPADLLRGLSESAIDILFGEGMGERGRTLERRAAIELAGSAPGEAIGSLVAVLAKALAAMQDAIDDVDQARQALSVRTPDELTPLFEPSVNTQLVRGPINNGLIKTVSAWTVDSLTDDVVVAANRLLATRRAGITEGSLDDAAQNLRANLPALTTAFVRQIDAIVDLLSNGPPSSEIDALAAALCAWPEDRVQGLIWAARVALSADGASQVAVAATEVLGASDEASTRQILTEIGPRLVELGAGVSQILSRRWASGDEEWALDVCSDYGGADAWDAIAVALETVSIPLLMGRLSRTTELMPSDGSASAPAGRMIDLLARQLSSITWSNLRDLGIVVAKLTAAGADPAPLFASIEVELASPSAAPMANWAALVRSLVEQRVATAESLIQPLWRQIIAAVDLPLAEAPWLLKKGIKRVEMREAVLSAIADPKQSAAELAMLLEPLRTNLRKAYQVRLALVAKAATVSTAEEARACLAAARRWDPVPESRRAEFDASVKAINPDFGLTDEIAALRS